MCQDTSCIVALEASAARLPLQLDEDQDGSAGSHWQDTCQTHPVPPHGSHNVAACACSWTRTRVGLAVVIIKDSDLMPHICPLTYFIIEFERCTVANCAALKVNLEVHNGQP